MPTSTDWARFRVCGWSIELDEHRLETVRILVQATLAVVLVVAMTWIVLSPTASDEASKAALVIVGSAVGFLFGRQTATHK